MFLVCSDAHPFKDLTQLVPLVQALEDNPTFVSSRPEDFDLSRFVVKKYNTKIIGRFDRCRRSNFYELILLQL